ncbi:hypothetical protein KT71_001944 [Congregibacter litoralis KT71]|uniref:Uncharacterized protein n=1 Tax=Congregibacter litoralis KT71 TaxID=314285 RepID=V7HT53_9GAMM|nr:hypothetical protein KT71_001944 [Congregibacter litoralis KT71]
MPVSRYLKNISGTNSLHIEFDIEQLLCAIADSNRTYPGWQYLATGPKGLNSDQYNLRFIAYI